MIRLIIVFVAAVSFVAPQAAAAQSQPASAQAKAADVLPACALLARPSMGEGPVVAGFFSADVATARRVCPRTEVSLGVGGDAEIDIPAFRAVIGGGATLAGSYALNPRLELFGTLEAVRYTYAQNASPSATRLGLGQLTAGASYAAWDSASGVLGVSGRLMLPTTTMTVNVHPMAVELGATYSHRFGALLEAHGFAGTDLTWAITPATAQPRLGFLAGAGAQWTPLAAFAVALDLQAHFGDRGGLDYVAPALAFRVAPTRALGLELMAALHVLGDRAISFDPSLRTEAVFGLRTSWRF